MNLPQGQRYGFITQEVQKVMPTIVRRSTNLDGESDDFQVMEYDAIVPVLTEAIKLQQGVITGLEGEVTDLEGEVTDMKGVITDLEKENSALEARLARLEALLLNDGASRGNGNALDVSNGVVLDQNSPNPTDGSTAIN